jgi:hypothetical protein
MKMLVKSFVAVALLAGSAHVALAAPPRPLPQLLPLRPLVRPAPA